MLSDFRFYVQQYELDEIPQRIARDWSGTAMESWGLSRHRLLQPPKAESWKQGVADVE
jgi:hypothetical protein